jgi:hypothetical protein
MTTYRSTTLLTISVLFILFTQTLYAQQRADVLRAQAAMQTARYDVQRSEAEALARQYGLALRQVLPDGRVTELQRFEDGRPVYYITDNVTAAASISSDRVYAGGPLGFALSGAGVTLAVWDGGSVRTTHQEFGGRATQMDATSSLSDHATHVSGTMIAGGVKAQARGMAYAASLKAHDWNNDLGEMTSRALEGVQVSNHSYSSITGWIYNYRRDGRWVWFGNTGDNSPEDRGFGLYDSRAREWDQLVHTAEYYLPVKSAGNDRGQGPSKQPTQHWEYQNGWKLVNGSRDLDGGASGYDCISTYGNAKNIMTVGAVEDIPGGYSTASDVRMTSFSGWGPADDGRIKPDIVANGTSLYSSVRSSNAAYATSSGTSMSSPSVAGSIGLLLEHQRSLHGDTRLRASTIKGLILHTADEAGPAPGPDYMHGWGLMNTGSAAKLMQQDADGSTSSIIREETLQQNGNLEFQVYSPGRGPMKVTICWTDPAGPVQPGQVDPTDRVLVNDLDLRIIDPLSATHLPWLLDPANPAEPAARGDNIADNVEQVFIASPAEGFYTVRITHKGSLQGQQQLVSIIASVSNAPALMSPPSGLTELSLTPALQWSPARGATSYDVQVALTPEFATPVVDATGIVDSWYTPGGLQRLENYYWRVRARDAQGASDWSDIWRFETGSTPSRAGHALYFDGFDDAAVLPHRAEFDAIEQQDAVTVEAWINIRSWQDGRFPVIEKYDAASDRGWSLQLRSNGSIEFTGTSAVSCNFSPQLDTWYHIAVSYARAEGKIRFFVDGARRCEVNYNDELFDTGDGALYIGASPANADNYAHGILDEVRVWAGARSETDINAQMFSVLTGTENGLAAVLHCDDGRGLTAAAAPGTGEAALRQGPAWLVSSVPMTEPPVPVLLYPGQNSANIPVQPQLRWMAATSAMRYRVQVSSTPDFTGILFDERNVTATEIPGPSLQAETEYWWRANAENPVGSSDWSVPHRFTTAVAPPPAPTLVSPRDATADMPLERTLLWDATPRARHYHVQVSADSLFEQSFVLNRTELISPTADVKDLGNFQQYYWRVRASNFGGSSPWSDTWRFTTLPAEPEAPLLKTPAVDERGVSLAPQFTWESVESATTYSIQLAEDSAFTALLLDVQKIPFTRYAASNLQQATWYYWRARASNSAGDGPWSAVRRFQTLRPVPGAVQLRTPADRSAGIAHLPQFRWESVEHAAGYRLEIAEDASFDSPVLAVDGMTGTNAVPADSLAELQEYHWRVRAENESGEGAWSAVWTFTTEQAPLALPGAVTLLEAGSDQVDLVSPVLFRWTSATPEVTRYWHEIAEDAQFTASVLRDSTLTDTVVVLDLQLPDGTDFWWRVRAGNAAGWGPWSEIRRNRMRSTTGLRDAVRPAAAAVLHANYPNPFGGAAGSVTTLGFTLPRSGTVRLEVRDMLGRLVALPAAGAYEAGTHRLRFDARTLPPGSYLLLLRTADVLRTRLLTLQ